MIQRPGRREFAYVPLDRIDEPQLPSRSQMDEQRMEELAENIRALGVLQPLILARVADRYEVIAGHRRWHASRRAGLVEVPALIFPDKSAADEAAKFAENHFREDLNAADEAIYFAELLELHCGGDTNRLAELVHKKRDYVEGRLLLFSGDTVVFTALSEGKIKIGIAHELNKCSEELMRRYFLDCAIRGGATIATVTGWVQQWRAGLGPGGESGTPSAPASDPSPVAQTNYFTCYVCGGTEDVHLMQPVNVHVHCKKAILDKVVHGDQKAPA